MKHFGDITKISGYDVPIVDVVTGGSPCQDLSIAGRRAGLAGERSGLFMEQMRIVKEMRERDVRTGRTAWAVRPRYMVWENVCGAFSSGNPKGSDFAAVLEEIIRVAEPEASVQVPVPDGGWTKSGCYYSADGRWSVAWRVHDAQFWGVPQRRKRIALVADFGGLSAPEILFERKGLSGDFEPSGAERQGSTAKVERRLGESSYTLKIRGGVDVDSNGRSAGKGALIQTELSGTLGVSQDQTLIQPCLNGWDVQSKHIQPPDGVAESLYSGECRYGGGESYVMAVDVYNQSIDGEVAASLTAATGGTNTSGPKVISAGFKPRQSAAARSLGYEEETSPTINTDENYAVLSQEVQ